ncbi:hypothetical protein HAZT_HAZT006895 [Hyalella azteca]|uniref:CCHC-type domain-containing protein n=1 Tax=Hyalella azteca TaxID=294128 RepID=A0A6A0GSK7_HYAAZ|nr:hypothetical protein HAZT_HAZT006895 [Hyalella azteca]
MAALLDDLKAQGRSLGLDGTDLSKFVLEQQQIAREDRARERDLEKARIDAEAEKTRLDHELQMRRLQNGESSPHLQAAAAERPERPKLPVYKDGDDITSFFVRFERIASLLQVEEDTYAVRLGSLLTGRAVDMYASLSPVTTGDYAALKKALLACFCKTSEGYRQDFRTARLTTEDTYEQFSVRLGRLLDFWMESCNIPKTYEAVRRFILMDQFMSSLTPDLRLYVKEKNVSTLNEMVQLAHNWAMAHKLHGKKPTSGKFRETRLPEAAERRSELAAERSAVPNSNLKCHACGESGHLKRRCPRNPAAYISGRAPAPQFPTRPDWRGPNSVNFSIARLSSLQLPEIATQKYLCAGSVNGTHVTDILRDTGCTCVIVSTNLIPNRDLTESRNVPVYDYFGEKTLFPVPLLEPRQGEAGRCTHWWCLQYNRWM